MVNYWCNYLTCKINSFFQHFVYFWYLVAENGPEWCRLAYWELSARVGRQFAVLPESVNVFRCLPHGDGLCLATLTETAPWPPPESVRRTRDKIGIGTWIFFSFRLFLVADWGILCVAGVTLSLEADGVWVYNRSDNPIFVNSPMLDDPTRCSLLVYRVPTGHCLNIFDRTRTPSRKFY